MIDSISPMSAKKEKKKQKKQRSKEGESEKKRIRERRPSLSLYSPFFSPRNHIHTRFPTCKV